MQSLEKTYVQTKCAVKAKQNEVITSHMYCYVDRELIGTQVIKKHDFYSSHVFLQFIPEQPKCMQNQLCMVHSTGYIQPTDQI